MRASLLAKLESTARPLLLSLLPPKTAIKLYSRARHFFLAQLETELPEPYTPPSSLARTCWGITFRTPLFNAAGMYKNGQCYQLVARQGAGAYLAGTTTALPREGNERAGVRHPFAPYPRSHASSNWLGLPNDGDIAVSARLGGMHRERSCPVGVSLAAAPELTGPEKVDRLIDGLSAYAAAGVDFIEINESCPNTDADAEQRDAVIDRLMSVQRRFLSQRDRPLPVIVKFSNDTEPAQIPWLIGALLDAGFDGVNFGNTSTDYRAHRERIAQSERPLYDYFTSTFGGGLGGAPLRQSSLALVRTAAAFLSSRPPPREFHIIQTGGVESAEHVAESLLAGASLVQWYTGYYESFARSGHHLYREICSALADRSDLIGSDSYTSDPLRARG